MIGMELLDDDHEMIDFVEHLGRPRKPRRVQIRKNHFNYWDNDEFYRRFRLSKVCVQQIFEEVEDAIKSPTNWNQALSPMEMLLLTLRFFASGSMLVVVGDFMGIHKSTASRIIFKVTQALARLRTRYIKFPSTRDEISTVQREFYDVAKFPSVVGALDCTHVKIQSPGGDRAEEFRNRKQFFSFNVQVICDANLKILDIVARWPGSAHDSTIFNNSGIKERFDNREFGNAILLGDAGYPLKEYLITPLSNVHTAAENLFNESQIRTRNPVERTFGVWKRRFPILSKGISLDVRKVQWVVVATAVLHNIACLNNEPEPPQLDDEAERAFNFVQNVPLDNLNFGNQNNHRTRYINYFENL